MAFLKNNLTYVSLRDITVFQFVVKRRPEGDGTDAVLKIWTADGCEEPVRFRLEKISHREAEKLTELLADLITAAKNGSAGKRIYDIKELVEKAKAKESSNPTLNEIRVEYERLCTLLDLLNNPSFFRVCQMDENEMREVQRSLSTLRLILLKNKSDLERDLKEEADA